jgi:hypothetical protein
MEQNITAKTFENRLKMSIKIKRFVKSGAPHVESCYPKVTFLARQRQIPVYV